MKEYIEREATCKGCVRYGMGETLCADCVVKVSPAADVVPVVHGRWIEKEEPLSWCEDDVDIFWECSVCKARSCGESPYCPNCGAHMKDGE